MIAKRRRSLTQRAGGSYLIRGAPALHRSADFDGAEPVPRCDVVLGRERWECCTGRVDRRVPVGQLPSQTAQPRGL